MLKDLKGLFKETAVYGLSTVAGRLLNILLLPLYTHCLTTADYGIVATLFAYIAFLNVLYAHGMDLAFIRFGIPGKGAEETRDFSTPFWSIAATSLAFSALIHATAGPLSGAIGLAGWERSVRWAAWILALDAVTLVPFAELRLSHRAFTFVGIKVANIAVNLALNVVFVARLGMGIDGVFAATLAASAATALMLAPAIASKLKAAFDRRLHRQLVAFGLPLIPAGLAAMTIQVADRPMLKAFAGDAAVGLYQANHKLAIFMMMAINMFEMAWRPFYVERQHDPRLKDLLARTLTYFAVFTSAVGLGVSLFLRDIVALPVLHGRPLIHPDYWIGLKVAPVVMLGYLLNGIYYNLNAPLTLAKRTDYIAYATVAGALANILANRLLIPPWGMMGAAAAVVVAYGTMCASLLYLNRRAYPVDYEYGRLLHVALLAAGLAGVAVLLRVDLRGGWSGLAAKSALLAALPAGLWLTGFLNEEERGSLSALMKRHMPPRGGGSD
ncbi:MAG: lipopolysaccharide biosynthesis protein [Elusimicrobia bacterium]|nr:lipopolysaccharide biosynthesis protein [Elusimicrobiota bacterium]